MKNLNKIKETGFMNNNTNEALDYKIYSNKMFYFMSITLLVSYLLQTFAQMMGGTFLIGLISVALIVVVVAYVFAMRGFSLLKKANTFEDTAYPNTGRNFKILTIVFLVFSVVLAVVMVFILLSSTIVKQELVNDPNNQTLIHTQKNINVIYGLVYSAVTVLSLQTITGLYMFRTYNIDKSQSITNNFTLFCAIFMITSVIISVLSKIYIATYPDSTSALTIFSVIINAAAYVISIVYFYLRGKKLVPETKTEDNK